MVRVVLLLSVAFHMRAVRRNMSSLRLGGHRYSYARIPPERFDHMGTRKMSLNYALDILMYSCRFCS